MIANDTTYKHSCASCQFANACRHTFGKFWNDRSSGGRGCDKPTGDAAWANAVERAARNAAENAPASVPTPTPVNRTRDDEKRKGERETWQRWTVIHNGRKYETCARSEKAAINFIRFKLYGTKPLDECGDFSARPYEEFKDFTSRKLDVANRLKRMAGNL